MSLITKWIKKKKVDDVLSRKLTTDKESQFRESIQRVNSVSSQAGIGRKVKNVHTSTGKTDRKEPNWRIWLLGSHRRLFICSRLLELFHSCSLLLTEREVPPCC